MTGRRVLRRQLAAAHARIAVLEAELATRPEPVVVVVDGRDAVHDALAGIQRAIDGTGERP